jgi:hypothetical protein
MNHYDELAFGNFKKLEAEWTKQKQEQNDRPKAKACGGVVGSKP